MKINNCHDLESENQTDSTQQPVLNQWVITDAIFSINKLMKKRDQDLNHYIYHFH